MLFLQTYEDQRDRVNFTDISLSGVVFDYRIISTTFKQTSLLKLETFTNKR